MPRKRPELNSREKSILRYIEKQIMNVGYAPSVREIGKSVGLSSTATVHGYLTKLEEKGYVKKCDPDLCAFIIYKVYVAVMFEWDKEIDENEVTQNVTQILKEGLFN